MSERYDYRQFINGFWLDSFRDKAEREIPRVEQNGPLMSAEKVDGEFATCEKHGQYEVKYSQWHRGKFMRKNRCSKCVVEREDAVWALTNEIHSKEVEKARREKLIGSGISIRNLGKDFDSFKSESEKQSKALASCKCLADSVCNGGDTFNLIMSGSVGTGKTHLASSIIDQCVKSGKNVRLAKLIDIVRSMKSTWRKDSETDESDLISLLCGYDLLIIDEIGVQFGSDTEKMFIFDIIDGRYENMKPTMLISNLDLAGIKDLVGERVIDRLREDGGKVLAMDWESHRGKK